MSYVNAYGENPPRWASPTVHAARPENSKRFRGRIGLVATTACGISARHGSQAPAFDASASNACKKCARIVERNR